MPEHHSVGIGIIGAGFLAATRARCYGQVRGLTARLAAVAARTESSALDYAKRYDVPKWFTDYRDLLALPEVDIVDLCVPNHVHRPLTEAAAAAGKHVVCTKPLTAYGGQDLPATATDAEVASRDRRSMLAVATADAEAMVAAAERAGVQLMYGENWVYAPAIHKAERLVAAARGAIVEMRGGECHSGSHSPYAKRWRHTGGGALLRLGAHPIGAMLYLKQQEGLLRTGRPIRPAAVTAETGDLARVTTPPGGPPSWIAPGSGDVETWATTIITFEDGARAIAYASDGVVGGMDSRLDVFLSNSRLTCHMSPNNLLEAYAPDADVFGDEYLQEKLECRAGWSTPMPDEDWTSGHLAMCQDFVDAVAANHPPRSDGRLGLEVIRTIYASYVAAATGHRVALAVA